MRILVAGGGTAGHITPALSVIEALEEKSEDLEILYIGSKEGMENTIVPQVGICFETIHTGKFRRYHNNIFLDIFNPITLYKNLGDFFKIFAGVGNAIKKIKNFEPDAIFLKGGYVSIPVGIAAWMLGKKFVIHESDIIPGLANKILSRFANTICVSFPEENYRNYFKSNNLVYTGNPIRKDIMNGDRTVAIEKLGFNSDLKTIMVICGSQGAKRVNDLIKGSLEDILYKYQLIHITGANDINLVKHRAKKLPKDLQNNYRFFSFVSSELKDYYAVSDLIIARASCSVMLEIAANKKPNILIPNSSSANNHQHENALIYSRAGASYIIDENKTDSASLLHQINYILESDEEQSNMAKNVGEFYKPGAANLIADEVLAIVTKEQVDDKEV